MENKDENDVAVAAEDHFAMTLRTSLKFQPITPRPGGVRTGAHHGGERRSEGGQEVRKVRHRRHQPVADVTLKELLKLAEMDIDAQNPIIVSKNYKGWTRRLGSHGGRCSGSPACTRTLRSAISGRWGRDPRLHPVGRHDRRATSVGSFVTPRESTVYSGTTSNFDSQGTDL